MKTIIALSAALLLSFTVPAYAGNNPEPVNKKDRHHMMYGKKKNKNKKHKHNKRAKRDRGRNSCNAPE